MRSLVQDVRFALRMLVKNAGLTMVAVMTLALGIGANTAVFSLVDAMIIRPIPLEAPDRMVFVWNTNPNVAFDEMLTTYLAKRAKMR